MASDEQNVEDLDKLGNVKLYYDVERVHRQLEKLYGYSRTDPLKIEDLVKVDQLHYHGTTSVEHAIGLLGIKSDHSVLDAGSGFGGPARYISHLTKCKVTALEIQQEFHNTAKELTKRCNLSDDVTHVCDDFLKVDLGTNFDFLVSWLVFLHIPDKKATFDACFKYLKPGGKMYIEDMFSFGEFTESENSAFQSVVYGENLLSLDGYKEGLEKAGFVDVEIIDVTDDWTKFTTKRYEDYKVTRNDHIEVIGKPASDQLEEFYKVISETFTGGHLGGGQIVATKPLK